MTTTREAALDHYMGTDFGTCPTCGARGEYREKRPNGNDTCVRGHVYPSASAVHMAREAHLEAIIRDILDWRAEQSATEAYKKEAVFQRATAALSTPATEPQVEGAAHIVDYTNWRGETARRVIRPIRMWWGKTEWHPEEQWMLTAWDCEKDAICDFAWQDMRPVQNPATSAASQAGTEPQGYVEGLEAAAKVCNERGIEEQRNFGLNRGTQNYFRARNAIRALAKGATSELVEIEALLSAGQGDDDGPEILPDFAGLTTIGKVEACLHLLELRRDVIAGYEAARPAPQPAAEPVAYLHTRDEGQSKELVLAERVNSETAQRRIELGWVSVPLYLHPAQPAAWAWDADGFLQPAADTRVVTVAWLEACVDALKYWNSGSADREIKEIRAIIEGGQDRG